MRSPSRHSCHNQSARSDQSYECDVRDGWGISHFLTQVIQAPLSAPNAIRHAGSSDWKYSSGWKKVLMLRALTMRIASRTARTRGHCGPLVSVGSACGRRGRGLDAMGSCVWLFLGELVGPMWPLVCTLDVGRLCGHVLGCWLEEVLLLGCQGRCFLSGLVAERSLQH